MVRRFAARGRKGEPLPPNFSKTGRLIVAIIVQLIILNERTKTLES